MMGYGGHQYHPQRQAQQNAHPQQQQHLQSPSLSGAAAHSVHSSNGIAANSSLLRGQQQSDLASNSPDLRKMTPSSSASMVGFTAGGGYGTYGHYAPQGTSDLLSRHTDSVGQLKDPYLSQIQSLQRNMNPMANFRPHPAMNPQAAMSPHAQAMSISSPQQSYERLQQHPHLQHRQTSHTHPSVTSPAAASPMLATTQPQQTQHQYQQAQQQQQQPQYPQSSQQTACMHSKHNRPKYNQHSQHSMCSSRLSSTTARKRHKPSRLNNRTNKQCSKHCSNIARLNSKPINIRDSRSSRVPTLNRHSNIRSSIRSNIRSKPKPSKRIRSKRISSISSRSISSHSKSKRRHQSNRLL
ncbi:hypothetical protein KXX11_008457 [Aspergillus fumigatus]|nr:hypothetical protein KXX11_008457 [Aspergillus fumigatus]